MSATEVAPLVMPCPRCEAPLLYPVFGKETIAVDADPGEHDGYALSIDGEVLRAKLRVGMSMFWPLHQGHWLTCPYSREWHHGPGSMP